jgi:hypothetical protein
MLEGKVHYLWERYGMISPVKIFDGEEYGTGKGN